MRAFIVNGTDLVAARNVIEAVRVHYWVKGVESLSITPLGSSGYTGDLSKLGRPLEDILDELEEGKFIATLEN